MFRKFFPALLITAVTANAANVQSLRIVNTANGADITGASIVIQSVPNGGFQGYESLDLGIMVTNMSGNTLEIGAKKIEEDTLQPDVQHTICFAGGCFMPSVFISPLHLSLSPGDSDDNFISHYLFDNQVHQRGVNHVSYVFYDANHPADSAVVHVTFNTMVATGTGTVAADERLQAYPNPAHAFVSFQNVHTSVASADARLLVTGMSGATTTLQASPGQPLTFSTAQLLAGVYHYSLQAGGTQQAAGRMIIAR